MHRCMGGDIRVREDENKSYLIMTMVPSRFETIFFKPSIPLYSWGFLSVPATQPRCLLRPYHTHPHSFEILEDIICGHSFIPYSSLSLKSNPHSLPQLYLLKIDVSSTVPPFLRPQFCICERCTVQSRLRPMHFLPLKEALDAAPGRPAPQSRNLQ
jgi:hypothetical protein